MCLFKAHLYVLCGHIDYDISIRCVQFKREPQHIANPDILSDAHHDDCIPHHPEPENGVVGNLDQFFIVSPDEIGPIARWNKTAEEDEDTNDYDESNFQSDNTNNTNNNNNNNRPIISGLCGKCTAAAEELIEMYQTLPYFGLAEDMVLDDAAVSPTDYNDNDDDDGYDGENDFHGDYNEEAEKLFYQRQRYLQLQANRPLEEGVLFDDLGFPLAADGDENAGITAQQHFAAQIDMHNAWAKGCTITSNDPPLQSDTTTTTLWSERKFVKNFDLLDDPFAVHGDNKPLDMPGIYNKFLTNVIRVMDDDDDDSSTNNNKHLTRSRLSRTHTTNLVIRNKQQQTPDKKRKRSVSPDMSTASLDAVVSSGELHHQDKKRKTSTVSNDCPYALRSRPSVSLANGL
ncbi:hypothetical protein PISL3812_07248 [Talaromyces islandicus]|uniref:Uncharacterized protein n=1 Tax=Talaromyces islandicus TaxID=28573 RepID=A0A0U1M3R6_TALIS|nr:hypothetical protein PISL3812_07248 [Talaromyces islandicus]